MNCIVQFFIETFSDIGLALSFLSLIATIVLSVSIYWLQRKHEKEIEKLDENLRRQELRNQANVFLIDNDAERAYLPWCVLASNLHRHESHTRAIYTNFCRCSDELQNEILKMANFSSHTISSTEWVARAFNSLIADIEKHKLGRNILYDGAKYFHLGYRDYKFNKWFPLGSDEFFDPIAVRTDQFSLLKKTQLNLSEYIVEYFDFLYSEYRPKLINSKPIPPIDYMCRVIDFENGDESFICAWVMELVEDISIVIHNSKYTNYTTSDVQLDCTDAHVETYEDKYYAALQALFNTYYSSKLGNHPQEKKRTKKRQTP